MTYEWINTGTGVYNNRFNWSPNTAVPGSLDTALFGTVLTGMTPTVQWTSGGTSNDTLQVEAGDITCESVGSRYTHNVSDMLIMGGTLSLESLEVVISNAVAIDTGGILNIRNDGLFSPTPPPFPFGPPGDYLVTVGVTGNGTLNIEAGGVVSNPSGNGHIGDMAGSTGVATVTGEGSTWSMVTLSVGHGGNGTLNINAGGLVENTNGHIGEYAGSTGEVTVTGAASSWSNTGNLVVGVAGNGILNIQAEGAVSAGNLVVGDEGTGAVNIDSVSSISSTTSRIGDETGSTGLLTVSDSGSIWTNTGEMHVGYRGGGTLQVVSGGSVSSGDSYIGGEAGSTGVVTVSGTGSTWNANTIDIGHDGQGTLHIESGGSVSGIAHIGYASSSTGLVTVNGAGSSWNPGGGAIGYSGQGTLQISNGGKVTGYGGSIATNSGSIGLVTVDGSGSTWDNSGSLNIGGRGHGTLRITNGGLVNSVGLGFIAHNPGSTGEVIVDGDGSTWHNTLHSIDNSRVVVGDYGQGTMTITNGGVVINEDAGCIGNGAGSIGTVTVDGVGSAWNNSGSTFNSGLTIGNHGQGTLNILNGGTVTNTDICFIGHESGSTGAATVDGTGSTWSSGSLYVGYSGEGTLSITNGAMVSIVDNTWVGDLPGANGAIHFNNGTLTTGGLVASTEELTGVGVIHTGGLASDVDLVFDTTHGNTQTVVLDDLPGQNITINVTPSVLGCLGAGNSGHGTLVISEGRNISSYCGIAGYRSGSTGLVTVEGANSKWQITGTLGVGMRGQGTLDISQGAEVVCNFVEIGEDAGSSGVVAVDGTDSALKIGTYIFVGSSGLGTLNIVAGGTVRNNYGYIGTGPGGSGEVNVDGDGSTWINTGKLYVGHSNHGGLTIQHGGAVSNTDGFIFADSAVTVSGTGSMWSSTGDLYVGGIASGASGCGDLNVLDSGFTEVAGVLKLWNTGSVTLAGGTIMADSFDHTLGGTFNFTGGTLHANTFNGNLVNQGGTFSPGMSPGTTTVNGDYDQQAGTLEIDLDGMTPSPNLEPDFVRESARP